jgi:hypothetical protein
VGREGPLGHLAGAIRFRCEDGNRSICSHTLVHNPEGIIGHCLGCPQITAVHLMQALHRRDGVDATRGPERCAQSTRRSTGFRLHLKKPGYSECVSQRRNRLGDVIDRLRMRRF